jgi:hypothetical protein
VPTDIIRLLLTAGADPVPGLKVARGYKCRDVIQLLEAAVVDDDDHDVWLREAGELLATARRKPETFESALRRLSRRAFRDFLFSPSVVLDYMVVSTPGLLGDAGYSDAEVDQLMPTIDRVIAEEWAARRSG